jgi:hypothetical protein
VLHVLFVLVLLAILTQAGCGGKATSGGETSPVPQPGTTRTYTITIHASETSGTATAQHSTTVTLIVE